MLNTCSGQQITGKIETFFVLKHYVDLDTSTLCFLLDHRLNYNKHYAKHHIILKACTGQKIQERLILFCFETLCGLQHIHTVICIKQRTTELIATNSCVH